MATDNHAEAIASAEPVLEWFRESRRTGGAVETVGTPRLFPPPGRADAPCRWEGSVVEYCTDPCRGRATAGHVRLCELELRADEDNPRCTRGVNSKRDPEIRVCASCKDYLGPTVAPPAAPPTQSAPAAVVKPQA